MPMGSRLLVVALLLLSVPGVAPAAGATATGDAVPPVEKTTLTAQLQPDGDARWTVTATYNLTDEASREAFRTVAEAYVAGETDASLGLSAFREAAGAASETTGREMTVTDVEREASPEAVVANGTGRLTVRFTWTNFAAVDGDRLAVGDVFGTPEGTWLPGLDPNQRLELRPPDGYAVFNASSGVPAPQNATLVWTGPTSFGSQGFSVTFAGDGGPSDPASGSTPWLVVLLTLGLGGTVVAAYLVAQRRDGPLWPPGTGDDDPPGAADAEPTDAPPADAPEETPDEPTGAEPELDTPADDAATGAGADAIDEELLSDEERVERLLERNGGRMKQATIVKETGWSNAKVSQLLSSMAEEDRVDKLRIGRENLISFPDEDVTDFGED